MYLDSHTRRHYSGQIQNCDPDVWYLHQYSLHLLFLPCVYRLDFHDTVPAVSDLTGAMTVWAHGFRCFKPQTFQLASVPGPVMKESIVAPRCGRTGCSPHQGETEKCSLQQGIHIGLFPPVCPHLLTCAEPSKLVPPARNKGFRERAVWKDASLLTTAHTFSLFLTLVYSFPTSYSFFFFLMFFWTCCWVPNDTVHRLLFYSEGDW